MSLKLILMITSLSFSTMVFSKTYSAFLGAGGEPAGASTLFDTEISDMGKLSRTIGGENIISLNGGHSKTEEIINKKFSSPNQPFVEANFNKVISNYEEQIKSGKIGKDDQLLLIIDTHGAASGAYDDGEKTHHISLTGGQIKDFNTAAGARSVSMDRLTTLTKLAEEKGIKLAIIDLSCHSGNSILLHNSKTCVISASGPDQYSYGSNLLTFPRRLFKYMKKGSNLEEAFLQARSADWDIAFPMISTPAGLEINEKVYSLMAPYFYYYGTSIGKLAPYIKQETNKGEACTAPQEFQSLLKLISEAQSFKDIARNAQLSSREANRLKKSLTDYYELQTKLKDQLRALKTPDLLKKEKFCSDQLEISYSFKGNQIIPVNKLSPICAEYSVGEILQGDFTWAQSYYKGLANPEMNNFFGAQYKIINKVMEQKEKLLAEYPDLKKKETFFEDQKSLESQTYKMATKVAYASQHLYETLYKEFHLKENRKNACNDFVL